MEKEITAGNGLPVYFDLNPALHGFCLCLYFRAGSVFESEEENGITHFFEHAVFRNMNYRTGGELYRMIDRAGLVFNASTYKEFMQFEISGAREHFADACALMTLVFEPFTLPATQIDLERERIRAEYREWDDNGSLACRSDQAVWGESGPAKTILGKPPVITRIGRMRLAQFREKLLTPANAFFYVTGSVGENEIAAFADRLSSLSLPGNEPPRRNLVGRPAAFFCRKEQPAVVRSSAVSEISFSFDFDSTVFGYEELTLLSSLLSDGMTGKLYLGLSEDTGYIYGTSDELEYYNDYGKYRISFEVAENKMEAAAAALIDILNGMKDPRSIDLSFVLPRFTDNRALLLDSPSDMNWTLAYEQHILEIPSRTTAQRASVFSSITPERLAAISSVLFREENCTLAVKGDKKKLPAARIRELLHTL